MTTKSNRNTCVKCTTFIKEKDKETGVEWERCNRCGKIRNLHHQV